MKKAKVILTALTVFAVVGGALAFKAQKLQGDLSCTTSLGGVCNNTYITTTSGGVDAYCVPLTTDANQCTAITTTQRVVQFD